MMASAFALTTIAVVWMVREINRVSRESWTKAASRAVASPSASRRKDGGNGQIRANLPGILAAITAGDLTVERRLPSMSFALQPGESLDARIAPGAFRAEFTVPFSTALSRDAQLGVEFQGGKVIVSRRGTIILSDATGERVRTALTTVPVRLLVDEDEITIVFESDGRQPCRLRAVWKPTEANVPLPLPAITSPLLHDDVLRGMAFVQQANCAACHTSTDGERQRFLAANPGPILGEVGSRLQPAWIRAWLSDPQAVKGGASMPHIALSEDQIEDVTHFLASLGGPAEELPARAPSIDLANTGMVAYHTVGCFACHGPLEGIDQLPGGHPASPLRILRSYESLGRPSQKSSLKVLAAFLRDPVAHWPGGRMPSMNLTALESEAIAAYLISRDQAVGTLSEQASPFSLDQSRIERGRTVFAETGCANCHSLGPNRPAIDSTLAARSLESLAETLGLNAGCVSGGREKHSPQFSVSSSQRAAIEAYLKSLVHRRTNNVPLDQLAVSFSRLNCSACHVYHGERGPEAAVGQYFTAIEEADLGDEGRLPPNLSDVGAKLNPQWLREVLTESARARPYLGARMPQYGEQHAEALVSHLASASGVWSEPDHGPSSPGTYAEIGRQLVGANAMNCIQCHSVAGKPSTGTPGPDLAQMAERLRYDAFARWIHDPKLTRPGTRMPSFFVSGRSGFTELLEGDAFKQVEAMWAYLSLGEFMPLPDGFVDPSSLTLQVTDEPMIFRSFIKGAGVRAIAVGYPEQIHMAFDPERCVMTSAWEGEFINAAGAWANRGGTETNPKALNWVAPNDPLFVSASVEGGASARFSTRFRGYRLDEGRRPTFMYELRAGDIEILVDEKPLPARSNSRATITQRFTLQGPRGARIILAVGTRKASGVSGDLSNGIGSVTLDDQGKAAFELEVTW